jgi:proline iminopeptidase
LILLHGGPEMDHTRYLKTWAKYINNCQLIMFDQRGNGRSDYGDPKKWTLKQWAKDVALLCNKINFISYWWNVFRYNYYLGDCNPLS